MLQTTKNAQALSARFYILIVIFKLLVLDKTSVLKKGKAAIDLIDHLVPSTVLELQFCVKAFIGINHF